LRLFTRLHYPYGLSVRKLVLLIATVAVSAPAPVFADAVSVPAPQRTVSSFSFFSAATASTPKAYWNPCQVIRYGIDTTQATAAGMTGSREVKRWKSAVNEASRAMGVTFQYVGRVHARVAKNKPARLPGVDIVITYGNASRSGAAGYGAALAGTTAGVAGVNWTEAGQRDQITSGYVVIDARDAAAHTSTWQQPFDPRPATQRNPDPLRALYMHEFGHALGLEHVEDSSQIMYPRVSSTRPDIYGSGDRAGLQALGSQACF